MKVLHKGDIFEQVFINEPGVDLHIVQEAGSRVKIHIINLSSANNNIVIEQAGKGCETEIYALAYLHGEEQVTTETHVKHAVGGGRSNQLIKFVLDDNARGRFVGDLKIVPDAQQTEAHQTNRNLLLSETAEMRTQPQLEIYADDVQATHGASTGQLDESALFYMQQRGISKQKARQLLVNAFMKEVIESIPDTAVREQLLNTIDGVVE
ncbi:MAG: SufD family Fe-S cluster assembly protein [Paludibacteraceae bacterium]|nr:SufD family Fe-S cluster assembly protein [Paludibacteraceae bacterium]